MKKDKLTKFTKEDLIKLYRNAKNNKHSEAYFDVVNKPAISWVIDISDDKINYYYGPTIWRYSGVDSYIGLIFQDRATSKREIILYYEISNKEYTELLAIWEDLNKSGNRDEKQSSGHRIIPQETDNYLVNKLTEQLK